MPIHEFTCTTCGHHFEELLFGDEKAACPKCRGEQLHKGLSTFAVGAGGGAGSSGQGFCGLPDGGMPPGCGTCGDPRGPGACSLN
jgi:putative FmdB family regulatory protein